MKNLHKKDWLLKTKTNKRGVSVHRHEKGYVMKQKEKQIKVLKQLRNCGNRPNNKNQPVKSFY